MAQEGKRYPTVPGKDWVTHFHYHKGDNDLGAWQKIPDKGPAPVAEARSCVPVGESGMASVTSVGEPCAVARVKGAPSWWVPDWAAARQRLAREMGLTLSTGDLQTDAAKVDANGWAAALSAAANFFSASAAEDEEPEGDDEEGEETGANEDAFVFDEFPALLAHAREAWDRAAARNAARRNAGMRWPKETRHEQAIEAQRFLNSEVLRVFGVPAHMLKVPEDSFYGSYGISQKVKDLIAQEMREARSRTTWPTASGPVPPVTVVIPVQGGEPQRVTIDPAVRMPAAERGAYARDVVEQREARRREMRPAAEALARAFATPISEEPRLGAAGFMGR